MSSEENFDYKTALAFEKWLKLHREAKELEEQLERNREQQTLLLKEFPSIGSMKGMLRKEKKRKEPEKKDPEPEVTGENKTPPTEKSSPRSSAKIPKAAPVREELVRKLTKVEEKRRQEAKQDRRAPKDAGGELFHPTSNTAPPEGMDLSEKN